MMCQVVLKWFGLPCCELRAVSFFNPNSNPRCVRLLGIIKYLAVPNSLGSCCKYLMSPLDTVEVWGSSPHGPTIQNKCFMRISKKHSGVQKETLLRPICVLLPDASLLSTELGDVRRRVGNGCAQPGRKHQRHHRRLRSVLGGRNRLSIDVQRGSQRAMPHQLLHHLEFRAGAPQKGRVGPTKSMPSDAFFNSLVLRRWPNVPAQDRVSPARFPAPIPLEMGVWRNCERQARVARARLPARGFLRFLQGVGTEASVARRRGVPPASRRLRRRYLTFDSIAFVYTL